MGIFYLFKNPNRLSDWKSKKMKMNCRILFIEKAIINNCVKAFRYFKKMES